jgi:DNA-binding LacI/PurR family transcriptional regulator
MAIVRQSCYQPNRMARDMALGRKTTLGLILAPGVPDASAAHLPVIDFVLSAAG